MLVAGITSKEDLTRFITQEPLIETHHSLEGIRNLSEVRALYFGVGLCNGLPLLSAGLPVDVLSMLLVSEQVHVSKHILIADTHAITNGFDTHSVDQLARQYQETLQRIIENLGFSGWQVARASEIDQTPAYMELLRAIEASHDYIRRELADMRWFNREHDVNLKVGWVLNGSKNSGERSFDQEFRRQFDDPLGFVYVVPGRTFNPRRLHAAPYFCTDPEERILLEAGEDVGRKLALAQEKFGREATRPCENFLSQVMRLYDKTVERTEQGPLTDRLQQVINRCTK